MFRLLELSNTSKRRIGLRSCLLKGLERGRLFITIWPTGGLLDTHGEESGR